MDLVDIIEQTREMAIAAMTASTLYLTVVSGYLVVAYVAGNVLSKFQLLFVTALFFAFASFFSLASFGYVLGAHSFMTSYQPEFYNGLYIALAYWIFSAQIFGIIGSLVFMYQAQRRSASK